MYESGLGLTGSTPRTPRPLGYWGRAHSLLPVRNRFLERRGQSVQERLHRRLSVAPAPLVRPTLIVLVHEPIEVRLQRGYVSIDGLAKRHAVELVQQRLVKALTDTVDLRALGASSRVVDVFHRQVLIRMPVRRSTVFGPAIVRMRISGMPYSV